MSQAAVVQLAEGRQQSLIDEVIGLYRRGEEARLIVQKVGELSAYEGILEEFRNAEAEFESLTQQTNNKEE